MPSEDKTQLLELLSNSATKLREAASSIPDDIARIRPAENCWSILECIEHVVIVDKGFGAMIQASKPEEPPEVDLRKEEFLMTQGSARRTRFESPRRARPTGRFRTLPQAFEAFSDGENYLANLVAEVEPNLRRVRLTHPAFGLLTGYEAFLFLTAHRLRHADQVREIKTKIMQS
jgi:hypothetical protein